MLVVQPSGGSVVAATLRRETRLFERGRPDQLDSCKSTPERLLAN